MNCMSYRNPINILRNNCSPQVATAWNVKEHITYALQSKLKILWFSVFIWKSNLIMLVPTTISVMDY